MSIQDKIRSIARSLTTSEKKIASAILADYPFGALTGIQDLADRSHVSIASVARFVQRIGANGYRDFEHELINELRTTTQVSQPEVPKKRSGKLTLEDYAERVSAQAKAMARGISQALFEEVCALLADHQRNILLHGGRTSDSLAGYIALHLQAVRPHVFHIPSNVEQWPNYLLRMRTRDVVILLDFPKYQQSTIDLASRVSEMRGATIVSITDPKMSPIARYSKHVLAVPGDVDTKWDTNTGTLALLEALFVRVSNEDRAATMERIETWDALRIAPGGQQPQASRQQKGKIAR